MPRAVPGYTLQDPALRDFRSISFSIERDGEGGIQVVWTVSYALRDEAGEVRDTASSSGSLTPAQASSILRDAFLIPIALPQVKADRKL